MQNLTLKQWVSYFSEIRFWIILFFILRLYGITNPPLDPSTLWRQSDVLMIARNFYEIDNNIFYPRIDVSQSNEGIVTGVEFPIYNYLIYLVSVIFGYDHWYGRLINLVFASIGIYYFHKVIRKFYTEELAFNSSLILLASAWFAYSRTTFPDIFGASLCIASIYYGCNYLENSQLKNLAIYFSLALIGCLSKISAISILSVMTLAVMSKRYALREKAIISLISLVIILMTATWYFYWVPYLNSIGSTYFSMGFPISMGIQDIITEPLKFAKKFYDDPLKFTGTISVLIGITYSFKNKKVLQLLPSMLILASYFIIILKSGRWFYINGYYFVMYVPALALLAAIGISYLPRKAAIALIVIIVIENIANQVHVFRVRDSYQFYTQLEPSFNSIGSTTNDLIIVGCEQCSAASIYMSHRKGILVDKTILLDTIRIEHLKAIGFKFILLQKGLHGIDLTLPYELLIEEKDFSIYRL